MMGKYVHPKNIDQLFNNLLFDVRDKLTAEEIYNIRNQYNYIMLQEKQQHQEQEKQEQQQEQEFIKYVKTDIEKTIAEVIKSLNH